MSNVVYPYDHSIPSSEPSLCIPRVFANVSEERIIRCWELLLGVGTDDDYIDRVDMIPQHDTSNGYDYWRVFIHFNEWPDTPSSNEIRHRILQGETCKVVYDDPWWWNVSVSRRPKPRHKNGRRPAPYLVRPDPMDISMSPPAPRPPRQQQQPPPPPLTLSSLGPPLKLKKDFGLGGVHSLINRASLDDGKENDEEDMYLATPLFPADPIALTNMAERAAMDEQNSRQNFPLSSNDSDPWAHV